MRDDKKLFLFCRLQNNDTKILVTHPLDQNFSRNPMVLLVFWLDHVLLVKNMVLLEALYDNRFYEIPLNKPFFTPKERGPIKKRVAPSDSSKNFGLGGMSPKFFYRYWIACKKPIFLSSWSKKLKNRRYLLLEDPYFTGYTLTIKKFRWHTP